MAVVRFPWPCIPLLRFLVAVDRVGRRIARICPGSRQRLPNVICLNQGCDEVDRGKDRETAAE